MSKCSRVWWHSLHTFLIRRPGWFRSGTSAFRFLHRIQTRIYGWVFAGPSTLLPVAPEPPTGIWLVSVVPSELPEQAAMFIPLGRAAQPEEQADAITFLCTPAADFITGQVISVNGGADTPD